MLSTDPPARKFKRMIDSFILFECTSDCTKYCRLTLVVCCIDAMVQYNCLRIFFFFTKPL